MIVSLFIFVEGPRKGLYKTKVSFEGRNPEKVKLSSEKFKEIIKDSFEVDEDAMKVK
jgi:hypothetical protein